MPNSSFFFDLPDSPREHVVHQFKQRLTLVNQMLSEWYDDINKKVEKGTSLLSLMRNAAAPKWCEESEESMEDRSGIQKVSMAYPASAWW